MIRNFLFHRVNPRRDDLWDPMDVKLFDKCVRHISNCYEVVPLEDAIGNVDHFKGEKIATLEFDDGYKDNIEFAAPILTKYNCKATFNVVTDCIDKNVLPWNQILKECFRQTNITDLNLGLNVMPPHLRTARFVTRAERLRYHNELSRFLAGIDHEQRNIVLMKVVVACKDVVYPEIMMSWNDLKELKNAGHTIGSHTATHSMLATISDENEIRRELQSSGNRIKEKLGDFPLVISYPKGSYNETTIRISKEVGYKAGMAVKQNVYHPGKDNIFEIPRIELYNESWWKTKLRINNTLENIKTIIRYREMN